MSDIIKLAGRVLIAVLFLGRAFQKVSDPTRGAGDDRIARAAEWLVWPVALFDLVGAVCLIFGPRVRSWALVLAGYCLATSWFHWQLRADPWR